MSKDIKDSRYNIRVSVIAISAIIYYLFYLITSPHALNSSQTPLAKAIENNDEVAFEASINEKSLRAKSGPGWTSLSIAIDNGNIHFVERLLVSGANPNGRSDFADTPEIVNAAAKVCTVRYLGYGSRENALDILKLLIRYGADVNLRDNRGETALLRAAKCGANDLARVLIEAGANPNIVSNYSAVPLHAAIFTSRNENDLSVVRTLISAGANPFVLSSDKSHGKTAFDIADAYQDPELTNLLKTGRDLEPLKPYLSDRRNIDYEAWRLDSLLSEIGVGIPIQFLNWITNHKLLLLLLPTCLSLLVGVIRRDKIFLRVGLAQPLIMVVGFILLLVFGKDS